MTHHRLLDSEVHRFFGHLNQAGIPFSRLPHRNRDRRIKQAVVGHRLSDISHAVQRHVESAGYSVVTEFVGHGIGRQLHEEPQVPNYGKPGQGPRLQAGMVLAIEPMVNMGGAVVKVLEDRWTAVTVDGSLSAHFEHTIVIEPSGPPRILSQL